MTNATFATQVDRLRERFGRQTYSQEFVKLLWREFEQLPDPWLIKTVDRFIGDSRHAPLMPEFREQAAVWREQNAVRDKQAFKDGTAAALQSTTLKQFIKRTIDSGNPHELEGLVSMFGAEWVEKRYREAK